MTAFEDFVNLELPRRSAFLTVAITGFDGDPNDGGAPAIISGAPLGTWYQQETPVELTWRKAPSGAWVQDYPVPIVVETTTTRTLVAADHGKIILFTNVAGCLVTVPATLFFGFSTALVQDGGGTVTLAAGGTLTFKIPASSFPPPETLEDGSLIVLTVIDVTGGSERALVFGRLL